MKLREELLVVSICRDVKSRAISWNEIHFGGVWEARREAASSDRDDSGLGIWDSMFKGEDPTVVNPQRLTVHGHEDSIMFRSRQRRSNKATDLPDVLLQSQMSLEQRAAAMGVWGVGTRCARSLLLRRRRRWVRAGRLQGGNRPLSPLVRLLRPSRQSMRGS